MRYIQLKNKILKLENDVRFLIVNNHYKNLEWTTTKENLDTILANIPNISN